VAGEDGMLTDIIELVSLTTPLQPVNVLLEGVADKLMASPAIYQPSAQSIEEVGVKFTEPVPPEVRTESGQQRRKVADTVIDDGFI
jgi:hypothetical protein